MPDETQRPRMSDANDDDQLPSSGDSARSEVSKDSRAKGPGPLAAALKKSKPPSPSEQASAGNTFAKKAQNAWTTATRIPALMIEALNPPGSIAPAPPHSRLTSTKLHALQPPGQESVLDRKTKEALDAARASYDIGQFETALKQYEIALPGLEKEPVLNDVQLCVCLSELIDVYMFLGRPQDAVAVATRLQEIYQTKPKDKGYIDVLIKKASAWLRLNELLSAEDTYLEAMDLSGKLLPPEDPIHKRLQKSFAEIQRKRQVQTTLSESENQALLQEANGQVLSLWEPPSKPPAQGASVANSLAKKAQNVWSTATRIPAFKVMIDALGAPADGDVATPPPRLTSTKLKALQPAGQELVLDGTTAKALETARASYDRGHFETALTQYETALSELEKEPVLYDVELCVCLSELIELYLFLDRPEDAISISSRLQEIYQTKPKDKGYIDVLIKRASAWLRLRELTAAEDSYLEAMDLAGNLLPEDDPIHSRLRTSFAEIHRKRQVQSTLTESEKQALLKEATGQALSLWERTANQSPQSREEKGDSFEVLFRRRIRYVQENILQSPFVRSHTLILSLGALLFLLSFVTAAALHFEKQQNNGTKSVVFHPARKARYISCDHLKTVSFQSDRHCTISQDGDEISAPFKSVKADLFDLPKILAGSMRNPREFWFVRTPAGFIDSDGTNLYESNAPEFDIEREMWRCADVASQEYRVNKLYPSVWKSKFYNNPFSGKAEEPIILRKRFAAADQGWTTRTKAGQNWEDESKWLPGEIHCANLDNCRFLIRGFDRNGKPLTGSEPNSCFMIELRDGIDLTKSQLNTMDRKTAVTTDRPVHVFISDSPGVAAWASTIRQVVPGILWCGLFISVLCCAILTQGASRAKSILALAIAIICGVTLGFWHHIGMNTTW